MNRPVSNNDLLVQLQTYKMISDAFEDPSEGDQPIQREIATNLELARRILAELAVYEQVGDQGRCEETRDEVLRVLKHLRALMRQLLKD
jgi:hypothetical protein